MAAIARDELRALGYCVAVMELTLAQVEMLPMWLAMCEDWRSGRIASMNFLSSYSNFSLQAYFPDDCQRKFPAIRDAVRALVV